MQRKQFLMLSALSPLALMASSSSQAQSPSDDPPADETPIRPKRRKSTPMEIRELEAAPVEKPFELSSLPAAEQRRALQMADAMSALMLKVLLSRKDPGSYRLSANENSLERQADREIKTLSPTTLARLERLTKNPTELRKKLRSLGDVDLKTELTPAKLRLPARRSHLVEAPRSRTACATPAKYSRLNLILQKLRCVDETNPEAGTDDMILGGMRIGAGGNVAPMTSIVCGEFDDGDVTDFGFLPIGTYSLNSTNRYPKDFYAIFQLVESDSDDAAVARDLTRALSKVAEKVLGAFFGESVAAIAGAVINALGNFFASLFDDDHFPYHSVHLRMNSENQFGGALSSYRRTGDISGHDGTYRIGYRWMLT